MNKDVPDDKYSTDKKYACENNDSLVTYCNNSSETFLTSLNHLSALYATKVTTKFILVLFFRVKTPKLALKER